MGETPRGHHARTVFLLLLALAAASGWLHAASEPYRGRILVEVLEEMRQGGLDLIFSSAVIRPDLRIKIEPTATATRLLLEQLLALVGPHPFLQTPLIALDEIQQHQVGCRDGQETGHERQDNDDDFAHGSPFGFDYELRIRCSNNSTGTDSPDACKRSRQVGRIPVVQKYPWARRYSEKHLTSGGGTAS